MKSFSAFLIEENKQTIIHKLGWQDADNWWGTTMNYKKKISIANEHGKKLEMVLLELFLKLITQNIL